MSMSVSSVPKKPPRGHKSGKETGILMTVIKTLSSSATSDERDRDREKAKLEKEYKLSDQRLDGLISKKHDSLNRAIQTFGQICNQIDMARQRLSSVKVNLQKCKMLLHCGRGELEHLWLEGIEHKHALEILEQIDQLRCVTPQFNKLMGKRQYSLAAEILVNCLGTWNERLEQIEGLRDARKDLNIKKNKFYETLLEELNNDLYVKSAPTVVQIKRQGSGHFTLFQRASSDRQSSGRTRMNQIKARKIYVDINVTTNSSSSNNNSNTFHSLPGDQRSLNDTGDDFNSFMSMVINCMVLLEKLPIFIVDLKSHMNERLLGTINHISQQIIEYTDTNGMEESGEVYLLYLLQLTFNQFRTIIKLHTQLLSFITKAIQENNLTFQQPPTVQEIWFGVQLVLQQTLKMYFDVGDFKSPHHHHQPPSIPRSSSSTGNYKGKDPLAVDISIYFARKKQPRQKKNPLFKFEYSLHGLNINESMNHDSTAAAAADRNLMDKYRFLVCKPNPRNIIVIYNTVQEFIVEIEQTLGNGEKCELRKFMSYNVERVFNQMYKNISDILDSVKKSPDSWKNVTTTTCIENEDIKILKCVRPIFQNVVMIGRNITDIISLIKDLPSHCDQTLPPLDGVLTDFKKLSQDIYDSIVVSQIDSEEKKYVVSATWVKDEDFQRLLKSLPNWSNLQKQMNGKLSAAAGSSPDDLRSQNLRESDLLFGVFGGKKFQSNEIFSNMKQLEQLGHLLESMDWFSETLLSVASSFEPTTTTTTTTTTTCQGKNMDLKNSMNKLIYFSSQFEELSQTCLLVLHLEIRVYCFYYLTPLFQTGEFSPGLDNQIADNEVIQFNKILTDIENVLNSTLQPEKFKYIFDGIGQLITTVFIRGAQDIHRINENGVKKICRDIFSIQQTLCNITNQPEHTLDHAREYYELFLHPIDELFDTILEKGPQFKELEYMNVIQGLNRAKPGNESLNEYLTRLSNILGDVGVTV